MANVHALFSKSLLVLKYNNLTINTKSWLNEHQKTRIK